MEKERYLNLGCGQRFFDNWENLDFISNDKNVTAYNLLNKLPYNNDTFDVVYHSHVLEHFSKKDGDQFIKECIRVLKPGGIIRIVVPDLEQIALQYLTSLRKAEETDNAVNKANYDWSVIEMYDQCVRDSSGGEMGKYWDQEQMINEDFVKNRMWYEVEGYKKYKKETLSLPSKNEKKTLLDYVRSIRNKIMLSLTNEKKIFDYANAGRFRLSGEVHLWMYDKYSLKNLLMANNINNITIQSAFSSMIKNWDAYKWLDVEQEKTRKPDSLFIEGIK